MLKTKHNLIAIGILGIALAVAVVIMGGISWHRAPAPHEQAESSPSTPTSTASSTPVARVYAPHPPHGSVTYQIAQAATRLPGFVQATIDPADVHVGQVQHFTIITDDPNPVVSVVAEITTDHKTVTVPLASQGAPAVSMLVPRTITVTDDRLALVTPGQDVGNGQAHIADAATANDTKFTGQWTVEDTHAAKYQTTFTAKDAAGNENTVTLAWTDPCPFTGTNNYGGGTATVSGNCEMPASGNSAGLSAADGPEHGNLAVAAGTLIIDPGATLVMNGGYNISFSGGTVAVGGQIVFGQDMCGTDNDGDGYIAGSNWSAAASCGAATSRVNLTSGGLGDCNDGDARAYPGETAYQTSAEIGTPGPGGAWDFNCDGTQTLFPAQAVSGCTGNPNSCGIVTKCTATYTTVGVFCGAAVPYTCDIDKSGEPYSNGGSCPQGWHSCTTDESGVGPVTVGCK